MYKTRFSVRWRHLFTVLGGIGLVFLAGCAGGNSTEGGRGPRRGVEGVDCSRLHYRLALKDSAAHCDVHFGSIKDYDLTIERLDYYHYDGPLLAKLSLYRFDKPAIEEAALPEYDFMDTLDSGLVADLVARSWGSRIKLAKFHDPKRHGPWLYTAFEWLNADKSVRQHCVLALMPDDANRQRQRLYATICTEADDPLPAFVIHEFIDQIKIAP